MKSIIEQSILKEKFFFVFGKITPFILIIYIYLSLYVMAMWKLRFLKEKVSKEEEVKNIDWHA